MSERSIVYIVGFMGSGKSSMGKRLAASMRWKFIDLDGEIERYAGKPIPAIFSDDGEDSFRDMEATVLRNLREESHVIVSTGGGTPCFHDNMSYMKSTGCVVYLFLKPLQLYHRLLNSKKERPLLTKVPEEELLSFITKKIEERSKWYEMANLCVDAFSVDAARIEQTVLAIINNER